MLRSAVTASSRTLLRLAASSARPSVFLPPLASTSSAGPPIPPLLPSASVLRFPSDFSRGYARGRRALSSSSEEEEEDDDDDDDFDDYESDNEIGGSVPTDLDYDDYDEEFDSDYFSD